MLMPPFLNSIQFNFINALAAVDAISNQGVTFMKQGRLTEALPLLKQVLERRLQLLSDDDPLIGLAHCTHAFVLRALATHFFIP